MTSDATAMDAPAGSGRFPTLVVEPKLADVLLTVSALSAIGFDVTVAEDFREAKRILAVRPTAVLITETRLSEYNGLHLVLRSQSVIPGIAALVTSEVVDPVLQAEAEQLGATYIQKPVTGPELVAAVMRTLRRQHDSGPIRPPFERRMADRRAAASIPALGEERRRVERRQFRLPQIAPALLTDSSSINPQGT